MRPYYFFTDDGQRIAYSDIGDGPAVLMIHGALAETDQHVAKHLSERGYRVIGYDRRGYGGSPRATVPRSMADHAEDAAALLRHLDTSEAHLVGQSYGGDIVLQFAHDYPEMTRTMTLQEPALPAVIFANPAIGEAFGRVIELQQQGNAADALAFFLAGFVGTAFREIMATTIDEGAFERAAPGIHATIETDLPALQAWQFGPDEALACSGPVLSIVGGQSNPMYEAVDAMLLDWFPERSRQTVAAAGHLMALEKPEEVATFLRQHFQVTD